MCCDKTISTNSRARFCLTREALKPLLCRLHWRQVGRIVHLWMEPPLAVSPLVELELRGKDERVGRDEKNTKVPDFRRKKIVT